MRLATCCGGHHGIRRTSGTSSFISTSGLAGTVPLGICSAIVARVCRNYSRGMSLSGIVTGPLNADQCSKTPGCRGNATWKLSNASRDSLACRAFDLTSKVGFNHLSGAGLNCTPITVLYWLVSVALNRELLMIIKQDAIMRTPTARRMVISPW